jgi:tRNA (guanine37-N1)-methyltransferase
VRFVVVTIFPQMFEGYLSQSIVGRALSKGHASVDFVDPRDFTTDRHRSVDDVPFGGGAGMVMKPEPLARALESIGAVDRRVLMTPTGRPFRQADAETWAGLESVVLVCGRYEGVDERVCRRLIDDEVSIGDFVMTGGELGALVVMDSTIRLLPGVLGNSASAASESFSEGLLEHPHYTRPAEWRGEAVPEVLLSGHHARIAEWRRRASIERTAQRRPDLLAAAALKEDERRLAEQIAGETEDER